MKIQSVRIQNFRSFEDDEIPFDDYTCLVGPNGSGKSTILTALNVFFRQSENTATDLIRLDKEDFHCKNTAAPITITVTFSDLSKEAQQDFADYIRQGELVISSIASYDDTTDNAEVKQFGNRLGMAEFARFFEAMSAAARVPELTKIYDDIRSVYVSLPSVRTKEAMIRALRSYEAEHKEDCILIRSEDQFYGFSKGIHHLTKHVRWVYVPAVKDPTDEQVEARDSALGKLLLHTVRAKVNFAETVRDLRKNVEEEYQKLLEDNQDVLKDIATALQTRLSEWAHPDAKLRLKWTQDLDKSLRIDEPRAQMLASEGGFEGDLARLGHGFQRSYLLALLQEVAVTDVSEGPTLIFACEEPELYQHPPQARHLADVLQRLSQDDSQVIVSTHSPLFVSGERFEQVRMVRRDTDGGATSVSYTSFANIANDLGVAVSKQPERPSGIMAKVHQALQSGLSEMFFTRRLVLVEGFEDVAYILSYISLGDWSDEYRRLGCHIVPANGKRDLLRPVVLAKHMRIPTYLVFDADADADDKNGIQSMHEKDNTSLLTLTGVLNPEPMPSNTFWGRGVTMWQSNIGAIVQGEIGNQEWATFTGEADKVYGSLGVRRKNTLHIGATLAIAWKAGKCSDSLKRLCEEILDVDNAISF